MDADQIRRRISDRLFNEGVSIGSRRELSIVKKSLLNGRLKSLVKKFVRRMPIAGPFVIWLWRLIKIPGRFYQLSEHFRATVEKQGIALQELDVLRATVEKQGIALQELDALAKSLHAQLNQPIDVPDVLVIHPPSFINRKEQMNNDDAFYQLFSNVFRGSESDLAARQQKYLPYVMEAFKSARGGGYFLDVGCGRGEFLMLLKNAGLTAKGIDINAVEHQRLADQGLDVQLVDANTFLNRIEDNSLIGISAFQTVEHFSDEYLKAFLILAYQKIAAGGVILIETVNPQCRAALANFYNDPSHVKPLPVPLLTFYLEFYGFSGIEILYSSPCEESQRVKDSAEHNYMDYAAIGRKI